MAEQSTKSEGSFDASDPAQVEKETRKAEARENLKRRALAKFLDDQTAREWLWGLLEVTHIFENCFDPGSADTTAFKLGERNIGLRILDDIISADPNAYLAMLRDRKVKL
jgi:hypothetical protein